MTTTVSQRLEFIFPGKFNKEIKKGKADRRWNKKFWHEFLETKQLSRCVNSN